LQHVSWRSPVKVLVVSWETSVGGGVRRSDVDVTRQQRTAVCRTDMTVSKRQTKRELQTGRIFGHRDYKLQECDV